MRSKAPAPRCDPEPGKPARPSTPVPVVFQADRPAAWHLLLPIRHHTTGQKALRLGARVLPGRSGSSSATGTISANGRALGQPQHATDQANPTAWHPELFGGTAYCAGLPMFRLPSNRASISVAPRNLRRYRLLRISGWLPLAVL